ncbi:MAG TPA: proton-conducting transporter membrane subunit [Opitutaceae bacterium]|nr:proton-conducting transporter membrane subunit [Opitutaceae bacterium]
MRLFLSVVLIAMPLLPLAAGLLARFRHATAAGRLTLGAATVAACLALVAVAALSISGPHTIRWAPFGTNSMIAVALRLDAVSGGMILLVTYLGAIVLRFSRRYLDGDPAQAIFFSWMSLTLGSVALLVLAGHLLLLLLAGIATSLCLHRLLLHYPERTGAVFSARKKFVVSRAGDVCLLAAAWLLYRHYRTLDLEALFAAIATGDVFGLGPVGMLLALCAMLKSAQFPFHSWLPDTMETPNPVSAFMHAGIINAGGFLLVRLSPVLNEAPLASAVLVVAGSLTAAFGAVVMLAQPSVKRALAYSTIAQMGFMVLQCGLGAYGLALLHIWAHSLYKAHAFLTAGSTIGAVPRAALPLRTGALTMGVLAGGLLVALGAIAVHLIAPHPAPYSGVFGVVLAFSAAYVIARAWAAGGGGWVVAQGIGVATLVIALGFGLHAAAARLFADLPVGQPPRALVFIVGATFASLFAMQSVLWRAGGHPLGRRLYVHALNGFYVGTVFNRLLGRLWPRESFLSR